MAAKIFIDGEAGTTGLGIRARLADMPGIALKSLADKDRKNPAAKQALMREVDLVILCLPDAAAMETVALADALGEQAPKLLDASTAHRVAPGWVYGFPELAAGQAGRHCRCQARCQPGMLCDGRHRAFAAACRCRAGAVKFSDHHQCGLRLQRRRPADDRGL